MNLFFSASQLEYFVMATELVYMMKIVYEANGETSPKSHQE